MGGGGVPMSLVWISKPVVSLIEEETMLLSVFFFFLLSYVKVMLLVRILP